MQSTIQQLSHGIRAREVSPTELTHECLKRIERLNPTLNAFITVLAESALDQARRAEQEIFRGKYRGPLHGIPIGFKDLIDVADVRTTAASAQFQDRIPTEDAEVVRRLRCGGAILLGKQNLHEFAYGGSSLISYYGEVHNPWDTARIAGGSSGGSAASVATGLGYAAIGTDTAGSLREPASFCGIVGFKPTYRRVSLRGIVPLAWSYDHVGPIVGCVYDAALVMQAIAGYDAGDPVSVGVPVPDFMAELHLPCRLRIGIPRAFFFDDLHPEVGAAAEAAIEVFRKLGAEIRDDVRLEVSTDRTLAIAEAYTFHQPIAMRSPELYQPATLARIRAGENLPAVDVVRAGRELAASRQAIRKVFDEVDVLLTPTVPILPPKIEELKQNLENLRPAELVMLRNTRPFDVWGNPAISVPCGFSKDGLPIGLQLASAPWREGIALQAAYAYEQATEWHKKKPELL